jgi:hypothetical protein
VAEEKVLEDDRRQIESYPVGKDVEELWEVAGEVGGEGEGNGEVDRGDKESEEVARDWEKLGKSDQIGMSQWKEKMGGGEREDWGRGAHLAAAKECRPEDSAQQSRS